MKTEESYANFQQITEADWIKEVFPAVKEINKPITEAQFEEDLILPCNRKFKTNNRMVANAISKFGGQEGLEKQTKVKGEVAKMENTLGFPVDEGNISRNPRRIYYPIVNDGEAWDKTEGDVSYKSLNELKASLLNGGCTRLAISEIDNISGTMVKRMIQYFFVDTEIEVKMYKSHKPDNKQTQSLKILKRHMNNDIPDARKEIRKKKITVL